MTSVAQATTEQEAMTSLEENSVIKLYFIHSADFPHIGGWHFYRWLTRKSWRYLFCR